ncbi:MAG: hypothetical protein V4712_17720 [Pseudomonadota bacterium]
MVRISPPTYSVASGELSELMYGRRDFIRFQNGARALRGFIPLPEGPITRLPGTRFMGFVRGDLPARLMAFTFRDEDAVLLEWTDNLLRFWRGGSLVQLAGVPYSIATPYLQDRAARLQSLQSADRIYLTEGTQRPHRLSRFSLTNWTIEPTPFTGGPFAPRNLDETKEVGSSGLTGVVTLTASADIFAAYHVGTLFHLVEIDTSDTPYWSSDIAAKIGDRVYYNTRCYQIVAFDDQAGRTGEVQPVVTPGTPDTIAPDNEVLWEWFADGNSGGYAAWTPDSLQEVGNRRYFAAGAITAEVVGFTVSPSKKKTTGVNPPVHQEGLWLAEKGGPVWKALHDGSGIVRITAITDARHVTGTVERRLPDGLLTKPTYRWSEQAWSDVQGWPRAIGGYEQRHIYAGTPQQPRTVWCSVIGGTVDMTTGTNDDDGFSYILTSPPKETGEIRCLLDLGDALFVGTSADESFGRATDGDRAFARDTARFASEDRIGGADIDPIIVSGAPLFIDKSGTRLYVMQLDPQTGKYRGEDLTQIARHILGAGCTKILRQELPVPIIWAMLEDGRLAGLTYVPSQQAVGFHSHSIGGGVVEDIEILPSDDGRSQDLWLVVRRTINGVTRRCVERMEKPFIALDGTPGVMADAWHQFCALRWQGAATTTISGLAHLNGEVVTAWTEFGAFTGLAVEAAAITLPRAVTSAIIGIDGTDSQMFDTLDIVSGQPDGGDDGRLRTHRASALRLHRTAGGTFQVIGTTDGTEVPGDVLPIFNLNAFETPVLRSGVFELAGSKGWNYQLFLRIRPIPGAPLTLTARTPTLMVTDD